VNQNTRHTIAVTPGEPAGIGPDLVLRLAQQSLPYRLVAVGDPDLLRQRAKQLQMDVLIEEWCQQDHRPGRLAVEPVFLRAPCHCGVLAPANAPYVLDTLNMAVQFCLQGLFDALVTGPVHKGVINDAGIPFTGHTEYLAEKTGSELPVMVLVARDLRVALATTHLALSEVSSKINRPHLQAVLEILQNELTHLTGKGPPRIAVCGLNPHAGEGGHLGRQEIDIIAPLVEELRLRGWHISGPYSADTIFTPALREQFDVILAMYHDQGLPALKALGFGHAVNVTLGLPIVRTSVDHGTALERSGTGNIDAGSLNAAMAMALTIVQSKQHTL